MTVSDYIVEYLISKGVTDVFGYPGGMVVYLMRSFNKYKDKIHAHLNYHEQAAAFAANGYAQVTGKLGVAYSTSGPGATNLLTGICNAYFDSVPVLFITGQVNTFESKMDAGLTVRQRGFQETEIIPIVSSVTKYSEYVGNKDDIRFCLEKAFYSANEGRKGPVLLDIPMDVQKAEIIPEELIGFVLESQIKHDYDLHKIIYIINHSKRPVIIFGNGVRNNESKQKVIELLKYIKIPFVTSMPAVDFLPDNELNYGFIGAYGARCANFIVAKSDLIISLGSRLDIRQVGGKRTDFAPQASIIRVDIDNSELDFSVKDNEIKINSDINSFLDDLLEWSNALQNINTLEWLIICNTINVKLESVDRTEQGIVINNLSDLVEDDCIVTTDVGQNQVWVAQSFKLKGNQRLLTSAGFGSMGYSLPAAIGAYYGAKKPVICFSGDGGIQMNIQELQFLARERIPIAVVILNNKALGMIRHFQEMYFDKDYFHTTEFDGYMAPDFRKISTAYGLDYILWDDMPNDFSLKHLNGPIVIEIIFNGDTYVIPKLEYGKPNQDQEPLIDRQLYEELMAL